MISFDKNHLQLYYVTTRSVHVNLYLGIRMVECMVSIVDKRDYVDLIVPYYFIDGAIFAYKIVVCMHTLYAHVIN